MPAANQRDIFLGRGGGEGGGETKKRKRERRDVENELDVGRRLRFPFLREVRQSTGKRSTQMYVCEDRYAKIIEERLHYGFALLPSTSAFFFRFSYRD